jgi:hypothetical protein
MLDVHPPHHAANSWRDFFIHIATIVIGLLIAVGLEQSVEAIHRHHEREKLRAALTEETRKIVHDAADADRSEVAGMRWLDPVLTRLSEAAQKHRAVGELPREPFVDWNIPDNPQFRAAKASGKLDLLSDEDNAAYGEMDGPIQRLQSNDVLYLQARQRLRKKMAEYYFGRPTDGVFLTHATPDELRDYYSAYIDLLNTELAVQREARLALGAGRAILNGERDMGRIQKSELEALYPK